MARYGLFLCGVVWCGVVWCGVCLQADAVDCGTEDFVVLAMSSSAATERVISLGSTALQALGVGSRAERLMKDISKIIDVRGGCVRGVKCVCVCGCACGGSWAGVGPYR
jgi:hypothetical protein